VATGDDRYLRFSEFEKEFKKLKKNLKESK
jgi:hypothetical protein